MCPRDKLSIEQEVGLRDGDELSPDPLVVFTLEQRPGPTVHSYLTTGYYYYWTHSYHPSSTSSRLDIARGADATVSVAQCRRGVCESVTNPDTGTSRTVRDDDRNELRREPIGLVRGPTSRFPFDSGEFSPSYSPGKKLKPPRLPLSSKLEPPETVLGPSGTSSLWTKSIISPSTTGSDPTGGTRPFAATPNNQTTSPFSAPGTPNAYQGGGGSGYPGSVPASGSPFTPQGGASGGGSSTPCPPHYAHSPAPSTPVGFNSHGPPQGPSPFPPGLYNGPGPNSPYYNNFQQQGGPPPRPLQPPLRNASFPPYSAPGQPNHSNNFGPQPFPPHFQPGPPHMQPGPQNPGGMPGLIPDRIPDHGPMPIPRRAAPYFGQPDYRIYELNKRLQQRTDDSDNLWWDAFATEFFEDDATLTLTFCLEDGIKRYTIGRTLIPRYFRSIFDGGVTDLSFNLKHPKESFHNTSITLDCDQCTMNTVHAKSMYTQFPLQVCTEGRLILEFTFDDLMRMKSWHFALKSARELVPRSAVSMHAQQQDPGMMEQLTKNITRQGITNSTVNYLRLCVILEPMQELMSRHKAYQLTPRDCLKTTLFQKWQRMVAPPEAQRPQSKRRKRKGSASNSTGGGGINPPAANKKRSPGPSFSLASQDVMVVGEPSLMGGEFGDEDERLITRLENSQYDAAAALDTEPFGADSPLQGAGPNSWQPAQDRPPHGKKKKQLLIM